MSSVPPAVFNTPTLGHAVRLGELYDQRSGKFLGVQLYPQDKVNLKEIATDISNTHLSISLSTTHQDKANLLDINPKRSLDYFGGLVEISGSATYLNDEKANTNEYAYALALKTRLRESRLLFTEDDLVHNVLPTAQSDYISTGLATHFVSSIVLGGNLVVNLAARKSELSREEDTAGKLRLELDKLKGAVSLKGGADATAKEAFKHLDDKFDLIIHSDVALDKVPIHPKDVLDTFPQAAALISNGGVPISATLQPIPQELYRGGLIFDLDADIVDDVVRAFSLLDDLSSRFSVLRDGTNTVERYVPELARTTRVVAAAFTQEHNKLRHALGNFLRDYQRGRKPSPGTIFSSTAILSSGVAGGPNPQNRADDAVKGFDITGNKVLVAVTDLHEKHLNPDLPRDDKISSQYRPSLAALENELLEFQHFASDVQRVRESLQPPTPSPPATVAKNSFYLSSIDDIRRAIRIQSRIPLFIMTPLTADYVNPNLAVVQYLALLRRYPTHFSDSTNPAHMLYAENLDKLEAVLPNGSKFSGLKKPSAFVGTVDGDGQLTWAASTGNSDVTLLARVESANGSLKYVSWNAGPLNIRKSFSIQVRAETSSTPTPSSPFFHLIHWDTTIPFLVLRDQPFSALLGTVDLGGSKNRNCPRDKIFVATFVHDAEAKRWILYLDDEEISNEPFTESAFKHAKDGRLYVIFSTTHKLWTGRLWRITPVLRALTKAEVEDRHRARVGVKSFQGTSAQLAFANTEGARRALVRSNLFQDRSVEEDAELASTEEEDLPAFIDLSS